MMPIHSNIKILLVEDDAPKKRAIEQLLIENLPLAQIVCVGSLTSAISAIEENDFKLAVIDMSIPTYEFAVDKEGGGQPEGFGGAEILRFIESESAHTISIIVTQYQEFPDKSAGTTKRIEELIEELKSEFPSNLFGVFFYSGQRGTWREEVKHALNKIYEEHIK